MKRPDSSQSSHSSDEAVQQNAVERRGIGREMRDGQTTEQAPECRSGNVANRSQVPFAARPTGETLEPLQWAHRAVWTTSHVGHALQRTVGSSLIAPLYVVSNPREPPNRRAVCGKTARTVRREGEPNSIGSPYPYQSLHHCSTPKFSFDKALGRPVEVVFRWSERRH
jgi:hypothetical protein